MRKTIYVLLFLLFCSSRASAQFTLVSGTVSDSNGMPYSCGTLSASIINNNGQSLYLSGVQFSPQPSATKLGCPTDPSTSQTPGGFTVQLADNTQLKCGSGASIITCATQTQWLFTINTTGVLPPIGNGPQTCTSTQTISGTSQSLIFICPFLARVGGGSASTFNVKTLGAKGDTQISQQNCTLNTGSPNMTCPNNPFTPNDVNKRANCGLAAGGGTFFTTGTVVTSFVSSSTLALSSTSNGNTSAAECSWGTIDDIAINKAVTGWLAALRTAPGQGPQFIGQPSATPPVLYFPQGGYYYCGSNNNPMINIPSGTIGGVIQGDAPHQSWLIGCDTPTNPGGLGLGFFINQQSGSNAIVIKYLAFTSALLPFGSQTAALLSGTHHTEDLYFTHWNGGGAFGSLGGGYNLNLVVDGSGTSGQSAALVCSSCNDEFHYGGSSNNPSQANTQVINAFGLNLGLGPRFFDYLNDEGSCVIGCFNVTNSSDVWIIGSSLFGIAQSALTVDGHSFVHLAESVLGVFGTDSNGNGLVIQTGGQVQSQDVRFVSTGTGKCINNSGSFYDNGGNTCETQFDIASTASAGTAATLTVNTRGANVNTICSVGDTLVVTGVSPSGYNGFFPFGITAVGVNTIGYTTQGSNLGAGAGGVSFCRNLQTYTGNLPKPLLNNPVPNTCYITGTFAATTSAAPMCTFKLQNATNISFIKASSTTTTACTVAPVVTISDGTVSQTLTITTAKSIWDSSVDTSTGVGTTIFKPNGTMTVTNTAGTCTTPPTNFGVSYNVAPILSN